MFKVNQFCLQNIKTELPKLFILCNMREVYLRQPGKLKDSALVLLRYSTIELKINYFFYDRTIALSHDFLSLQSLWFCELIPISRE